MFEIIEMSNDTYIEKMLTNWSTLHEEFSTQGYISHLQYQITPLPSSFQAIGTQIFLIFNCSLPCQLPITYLLVREINVVHIIIYIINIQKSQIQHFQEGRTGQDWW